MTKVNFSVGPKLAQKAVPGNGLYVYAYGSVGSAAPLFTTKIIENGTYDSSAFANIAPGTFSSGTILIVTQQAPSQPFTGSPLWPIGDIYKTGSGTGTAPEKTFGNIALIDSAAFNNYRYDSIELSLGNANTDLGNLTNIVQYGGPLSLTAYYTTTAGQSATYTQSRGYATTGSQLAEDLLSAYPTIVGNGTFQNWRGTVPFTDHRETLTADTNSVSGLTSIADPTNWNDYLSALQTKFQGGPRIAFFYAGDHQPGSTQWDKNAKPAFFYYDVEYKDGYVKLEPVHNQEFSQLFASKSIPWQASHTVNMMPGTVADGSVWGAKNSLAQNIYAQVGNAYAFASSESADQYKSVKPPESNMHGVFASNTKYGFLNEIMVTGFEAGFFGASALPIPTAKGLSSDPPVDLNKMWNWNGLYAYGAVRPNDPAFPNFDYQTNVVGQHYDIHAAPVFRDSNSYGWSFSDFIANSFGGTTNPQISLWDGNAKDGAGAQVGQVDIQVLDHADAPNGKYTPSSLSQYFLQPTMTASPSLIQSPQGQNGFQLQFQAALNPPNPLSGPALVAPLAPVADTPMKLRVHDGTKFIDIHIAASDYQNAYTVFAPGTGGYTEWTAAVDAPKSGGLFYFQNMPFISASNSVTWYQLILGGAGPAQKTYNIYVQRGEPTASGYVASTVAVDGGAQGQLSSYLPPSANTNNEVLVQLATGTTVSYDPGYWITADPSQESWPAPKTEALSSLPSLASPPETLTKPLLGKIVGSDTFSAFGSQSKITQGDIAFGYDPSGDNTTDGFNLVGIKLASLSDPSLNLTPVVAQANLSGEWQTEMSSQFADGTYTARMQQFKPYDWGLKLAVGEMTAPVTFTVELDKLPLSAVAGGSALQFTKGGQPARATGSSSTPWHRPCRTVRWSPMPATAAGTCCSATAPARRPRSTTPHSGASGRSPATPVSSSSVARSTSTWRPANSCTSRSWPPTAWST